MENFDVIAENVVGAIIKQACQGVEDRLGEHFSKLITSILSSVCNVRHDGGIRRPDLAHQRGIHRGRGQERHH